MPTSSPTPHLVAIAVVLGLGCAGGNTAAPDAEEAPAPSAQTAAQPAADPPGAAVSPQAGHQRMLAALREIQQRTDLENLWQGDGARRHALRELADLPPGAADAERVERLLKAAHQELRMGDESGAIAHLEEAERLSGIPPETRLQVLFRLAVAHLRRGETENCAQRHNAESCIFPIRGAGVHTRTDGSRRAIGYLTRILEPTPLEHPLHLKSLWLINIAYMTLGEYPQGVPAAYRVPAGVFAGSESFPRFENVAPALGLDTFDLFGGAIADDFDGDGWLDVMSSTFDTFGQMRYFHNDRDGTFSERTAEANLEGLFGGLNILQADYDNDGDLDVFVLRGAWLSVAGRHPNSLLRNDGHGRFVDVTFDAGLAEVSYPTQTGAWADYDNDGDVDLYIGNEHGDHLFDGPCQLFRNNGDGTFSDVAAAAGVDHRGFVKGVTWGDIDGDRDPDLYVSTLGGPNRLYVNQGDGTFRDEATQRGVAGPSDSFPVWFFDYDNDGDLDLYVPSYRGVVNALAMVTASAFEAPIPWEGPSLYRNDGSGRFEDVAAQSGLRRYLLPMGANYGDVDSDGWLDFYLGTGYPDYEALMPNVFYRNVEGRRFEDVTLGSGLGHLQKGHAIAFFDYDHDGDLDIFEQMGGAYPGDKFSNALFRNPGFGHSWVAIETVGVQSNRAGIGARLRLLVDTPAGPRSIYRQVSSGGSFGSSPLRQTIGLGDARSIRELEVWWPASDRRQTFTEVPIGSFLRVTEDRQELAIVTPEPAPAS